MQTIRESIPAGDRPAGTGNKKKNKKLLLKRNLFVYLSLLWPLLHFAVFFIYVNFGTVYASFITERLDGTLYFDHFDSYKEVFLYLFNRKSSGMMSFRVFTNVLSLMALAFFVNLPITLAFSYMIYKKVWTSSGLRILLYIPSVLSVVILCLFFKILFSGTGSYNTNIFTVLTHFGFSNEFIIKEGMLTSAETAWWAIMIFSVWAGITGNIIYFNSTMSRLPAEVLESAELDGASETRQFFSIILPMIWSTVVTMSVTTVGGCFSWFMPAQIMIGEDMAATTGAGTIGWVIVSRSTAGNRFGFTSAFGVVVAILGGALILGFKTLLEKFGGDIEY